MSTNRKVCQIDRPYLLLTTLQGLGDKVVCQLLSRRVHYTNSSTVIQVRLFRARKKTSISGEPASPIADSCKSSERIKTDYNSYLCTLCSLIVLFINNLYQIALNGAGYGFV